MEDYREVPTCPVILISLVSLGSFSITVLSQPHNHLLWISAAPARHGAVPRKSKLGLSLNTSSPGSTDPGSVILQGDKRTTSTQGGVQCIPQGIGPCLPSSCSLISERYSYIITPRSIGSSRRRIHSSRQTEIRADWLRVPIISHLSRTTAYSSSCKESGGDWTNAESRHLLRAINQI